MTRQPTLIDIPGILIRTVLRTIARGLLLAGGLLLLGSIFFMTWPSARTRRTQAVTDLLLAVQQLYRELQS